MTNIDQKWISIVPKIGQNVDEKLDILGNVCNPRLGAHIALNFFGAQFFKAHL